MSATFFIALLVLDMFCLRKNFVRLRRKCKYKLVNENVNKREDVLYVQLSVHNVTDFENFYLYRTIGKNERV